MTVVLAVLVGLYHAKQPQRVVVVYTSVDQVYSEPVLKEFEKETGIQVLAVYDVEATKTTGLVNRLIAEKDRPLADVFWNSEFVRTFLLKQQGIISPYNSSAAVDISTQYRDPENYWTPFGGVARVLLVNTKLVSASGYPKSIFDLIGPNWSGGQVGMAYPLFGTTATYAAALYAALGPARARDLFMQLKSRGVRVVDGNSVVRDLVASGQLEVGFTDSDDACKARRDEAPVTIILPDQGANGLGTLIIPNTVSLIAHAPHPREAEALIDYLASKQVEQQLVDSGWVQIPMRPGIHPTCFDVGHIKRMNVTFTEIYQRLSPALKDLSEIFVS